MGEESDAEWDAALIEWGREMTDRLIEEAIMGPPRKQRRTALRVRGNSFESVELDDAGNVIEPVRCICGLSAIMHRSNCPFAYAVT